MAIIERVGKHYTYGNLEFWAHQGMVHVWDKKVPFGVEGFLTSVAPWDFGLRAEGLAGLAQEAFYPSERKGYEDGADAMRTCTLEAIAQGDPTRSKNHEYWARHRTFVTPHALVGELPQGMGRKN